MSLTQVLGLLALSAFVAGARRRHRGRRRLLTVPALLAAGLPPQLALATNKGQACFGAVAPSSSFWTQGRHRSQARAARLHLRIRRLARGRAVLLLVKPEPLKPVVLVLSCSPRRSWLGRASRAHGKPHAWASIALVPVAFALGFYDGFFGPGSARCSSSRSSCSSATR